MPEKPRKSVAEAEQQGWDAAKRGDKSGWNPYDPDDCLANAWLRGFQAYHRGTDLHDW
jgi:hypothetical protein